MSLPKNTSDILVHMGFDYNKDFNVIDRNGEIELQWNSTDPCPTESDILSEKSNAEAAKLVAIAKQNAMPTYDELVSRVIALEAKTGIILTK